MKTLEEKLESACVDGESNKVKSLLKKGAKITEQCMTFAIRCRYTVIVKILLENGFDASLDCWWINWAIMNGDKGKILKLLIKYNAKIPLPSKVIPFGQKNPNIMKILINAK